MIIFISVAGCRPSPQQTAKPAEDQKYTYKTLCKKYADELERDLKEEGYWAFSLNRCLHEIVPRDRITGQAEQAYVKHIMETCKDKKSLEWIACHNKQVDAAMKKAGVEKPVNKDSSDRDVTEEK